MIAADARGGLLAPHYQDDVEAAGRNVHIRFRVPGVEHVEEFHRRAGAVGRDVIELHTGDTFGYCRIADPDGHHVEVYCT